MATAHKVLVVHCGKKPDDLCAKHGDFTKQIAHALEASGMLEGVQLVPVILYDGPTQQTLPDDVSAYTCVIFSGSVHDTTQKLPWMLQAADWIKARVVPGKSTTVPILGICFGHQLLGMALGGETMVNPRGVEVGSLDIRRVKDADLVAADPLVSQLDAAFPGTLVHAQSIEVLPEGAVALMETDIERNQLVRFAPLVYGTQFHPEYTREFLIDIAPWVTYGTTTPEEKQKLVESARCVEHSQTIVPRFVKLAIAQRGAATRAE